MNPLILPCPACGKPHDFVAAGNLVRCSCPSAPLLAYCPREECRKAVRVERAGDRALCSSCSRELAACQNCGRPLVIAEHGTWYCASCRLPMGTCRHRRGSSECGRLVPIKGRRATCKACGKTSGVCPFPDCLGLVPLFAGSHSPECPECRAVLLVCANPSCREVFAPGSSTACPSCGESLLPCPTPGCEGVVAARAGGRCDLCRERYRLCRADGCRTASALLANFCRECGAPLGEAGPGLVLPEAEEFDFRHEALGFIELPEEFQLRHRGHVRGAVAGGRPFFTLPTGAIVHAGFDPAAGGPSVRLARIFEERDFHEKKDALVFPPRELAIADGGIVRRFLLVASWRRLAVLDPVARPAVRELVDVRRLHGDGAALAGPPEVLGNRILVATTRPGEPPSVAIDLFELRHVPKTGLEARRIQSRVHPAAGRTFLGPVPAWGGTYLLVGPRTALVLAVAPEDRVEIEEHPLADHGTVLLDPDTPFHPGNPTFAGERVLFFGPDGPAPPGERTFAFHLIGQGEGGRPALVRAARGITENRARFVPVVRKGALYLFFLWKRTLHAYDLAGGVRALEGEGTFDPELGPVAQGSHLACRFDESNALGLFRLEDQGRGVRLARAAALDLGPFPLVSDPLFDGESVYTLQLDPTRPRRLAVCRGELRTPCLVS